MLPLQFAAPSQKAALWGTNCIPACCNGQTRRALTSMLGRDSGNSKAGSPAGPYSLPPGRMLAPAAYSLRPGMDGTHPANCFPPAPAGKADGHRLFTIYLYFSMERGRLSTVWTADLFPHLPGNRRNSIPGCGGHGNIRRGWRPRQPRRRRATAAITAIFLTIVFPSFLGVYPLSIFSISRECEDYGVGVETFGKTGRENDEFSA